MSVTLSPYNLPLSLKSMYMHNYNNYYDFQHATLKAGNRAWEWGLDECTVTPYIYIQIECAFLWLDYQRYLCIVWEYYRKSSNYSAALMLAPLGIG